MLKFRIILPWVLALMFVATCIPVTDAQVMATKRRTTVVTPNNPVDLTIMGMTKLFDGQTDDAQQILQTAYGRTDWLNYRLTTADKKKLNGFFEKEYSEMYQKTLDEELPKLRKADDYTPEGERYALQVLDERFKSALKQMKDCVDGSTTFSDFVQSIQNVNF